MKIIKKTKIISLTLLISMFFCTIKALQVNKQEEKKEKSKQEFIIYTYTPKKDYRPLIITAVACLVIIIAKVIDVNMTANKIEAEYLAEGKTLTGWIRNLFFKTIIDHPVLLSLGFLLLCTMVLGAGGAAGGGLGGGGYIPAYYYHYAPYYNPYH